MGASTRRENGRVISFLQYVGILQSRRHHAQHHRAQKNTHYRVVTNYLNPVLEAMTLWPFLERMIFVALEIERRADRSVSSAYVEGIQFDQAVSRSND